MDFANLKSLTIPEGEVVSITVGGVEIWKSGYTNLVPLSTEADGVTIYNGGKGYKDGYRVRSGGAEQEQLQTAITGYIPFVKGEKLYIYPPFVGANTSNTVNFYDSGFNCLGQVAEPSGYYGFCNSAFRTTVVNGVSVLDISNVTVSGITNVAYVRVGNVIRSHDSFTAVITSGSQMIITKNEEIEL